MNEKEHAFEVYREKLMPVLQNKCEEFALLGYKEVRIDNLWRYLVDKKWKKAGENGMLHELVNDVLAVKVGDYMHYSRMEAFKEAENRQTDDLSSFNDLFT
ncbi:MAG: post-transcriptional regulator [Bacillus sp. (in: firmicutes)]